MSTSKENRVDFGDCGPGFEPATDQISVPAASRSGVEVSYAARITPRNSRIQKGSNPVGATNVVGQYPGMAAGGAEVISAAAVFKATARPGRTCRYRASVQADAPYARHERERANE